MMQVAWGWWSTIADHASGPVIATVVGIGIKTLTKRMDGLATKQHVSAAIESANNRQLEKINGTYLRTALHETFAQGMNDRIDAVGKRVDDIQRRLP